MLAMHYAVSLQPDQIDSVRQRVTEIGPIFDGLPGLVAKAFLLATDDPCYSLYYLWSDVESMEAFLAGPRFAAVIAKYGRPGVTLYLTQSHSLPFTAGQRIDVVPDAGKTEVAFVRLIDPADGTETILHTETNGRFELLYLAGPNGS
jgi:hypothetical protein